MKARIPNRGMGAPSFPDPFGSMQGMMDQFQSFMQNPMQYLVQNRLNLPQNLMNDPQGAAQYLMNNGQLSQEQYNWAQGMARKIQQNPLFMRMFGR